MQLKRWAEELVKYRTDIPMAKEISGKENGSSVVKDVMLTEMKSTKATRWLQTLKVSLEERSKLLIHSQKDKPGLRYPDTMKGIWNTSGISQCLKPKVALSDISE